MSKETKKIDVETPLWRNITRRRSRQIYLGSVAVGGNAPITVQSMTNTDTRHIKETLQQVNQLGEAGADFVRVSCPDEESTKALKEIVSLASVGIIADIHFHYQRAIEAAKAGVVCLRLNPGNIGKKERVRDVIQAAKDYGCAIRIGVNAGSLERDLLEQYGAPCPEAMVRSALRHIAILEECDFRNYKLSAKASDVFLTYHAYKALAEKTDCPFHIGITEAGSFLSGTVKSSIGLGALLWEGLGDTIRVSLASAPLDEVKVAFEMLKSLNLNHKGVTLIACPSCARQGFDVVKIVGQLEEKLAHIRENITLSIMGCVVNGPGEASQADIGFTGGGQDVGMVYVAGEKSHRLSNDEMVAHLVSLVEDKAKQIRKADERAKHIKEPSR